MSSSFLRSHVARYLAECEEYWDLRGVPGHRIASMKAEMEPSVTEILRQGLRLEDTFGPAQEWAECLYQTYKEEIQPSRLRNHRVRRALFLSLVSGSLALFPQHFLHSVSTFPLTGAAIAAIAFVAVSVQLTLLPRWKRLVFSRAHSEGLPPQKHPEGKGVLSNRYFWCAVAGAFASQIAPIREIGDASSGFMVWSWLHTLALLSATVVAGLTYHKLDPARPMSRTWDLEKSLGLHPNSETEWERERRSEWVPIVIASVSVLYLACGWVLTPSDTRGATGLWLILGLYWLLYMSYVYLLGGRARVQFTDSPHP